MSTLPTLAYSMKDDTVMTAVEMSIAPKVKFSEPIMHWYCWTPSVPKKFEVLISVWSLFSKGGY